MNKEEYVNIFNNIIRGTPVSFTEKVLPMISEYLTEINYENIPQTITLIGQNPQLAERFMPDLVRYYCQKHDIISVQKQINPGNFKTILYYGQ